MQQYFDSIHLYTFTHKLSKTTHNFSKNINWFLHFLFVNFWSIRFDWIRFNCPNKNLHSKYYCSCMPGEMDMRFKKSKCEVSILIIGQIIDKLFFVWRIPLKYTRWFKWSQTKVLCLLDAIKWGSIFATHSPYVIRGKIKWKTF